MRLEKKQLALQIFAMMQGVLFICICLEPAPTSMTWQSGTTATNTATESTNRKPLRQRPIYAKMTVADIQPAQNHCAGL